MATNSATDPKLARAYRVADGLVDFIGANMDALREKNPLILPGDQVVVRHKGRFHRGQANRIGVRQALESGAAAVQIVVVWLYAWRELVEVEEDEAVSLGLWTLEEPPASADNGGKNGD